MNTETIETTCNLCQNPTFLCKCDPFWANFDKTLVENCTGKEDNLNNMKR